ncbi:MAG: LPS export ABC transporter permease LptG [Alphaproteobacteria bacterium]|nr:LPS export ABC transporter permease LptG [Alphaproteobacteria bacterium]MCW5742067.1 LPS export ABC transporter permease LptG [Alphaproteobacteria bacterium]
MNGVALRYLCRRFLVRFALVLGGAALLIVLFDALNSVDTIEQRYGYDFTSVARYMIGRLPEHADTILPLSVLVAALITLLGLAQANEILAFKSAGLSFVRIVVLLLPAAAVVAATHFLIGDQLVPWGRAMLAAHELERPGAASPSGGRGLWLRDPPWLVRVEEVHREGHFLTGVSLMRRDAQGNLIERVFARGARHETGGWRLIDVVVQTIDPAAPRSERLAERFWSSALSPGDFHNLSANPAQFTASQLIALRDGQAIGARQPHVYDTWLQRRLAIPAVVVVMLLLAAPVAQARMRGASVGGRLVIGVALGFLYFIVDGLAVALGEGGAVLPLVAAWTPVLAFASIGGSVLLRVERV